MKYYRRMQYEVETGEEECIVMLDRDGEGRQLEGFDASDSYTTPEFRNCPGDAWRFEDEEEVFGDADGDSRSLQLARIQRTCWPD